MEDFKTDYTEVTVTTAIPVDQSNNPEYAETPTSGPESVELWVMLLEKAYAQLRGGYNILDRGGAGMEGIHALTGQRSTTHHVSALSENRILTIIDEAISSQSPVTAGTDNIPRAIRNRLSIVPNHVYAPIAVDSANRTLDLQNPWGTQHLMGFSITDFKRCFGNIYIGQSLEEEE